jgi:hypothetical protein
VGLQINVKKKQGMTNQKTDKDTIKLDGQEIEWVSHFRYLGSMMLLSETDIIS